MQNFISHWFGKGFEFPRISPLVLSVLKECFSFYCMSKTRLPQAIIQNRHFNNESFPFNASVDNTKTIPLWKKIVVVEIMKVEYLSCQLIKIASQTHQLQPIMPRKLSRKCSKFNFIDKKSWKQLGTSKKKISRCS